MNVYDFDKTLFPGHSPMCFWRFCLKHDLAVLRALPRAVFDMIRYVLGLINWTREMQSFHGYLRYVRDPYAMAEAFWDENISKIYPWFHEKRTDGDIVVSAAPSFLVGAACRRLGIEFIGTDMVAQTGRVNGLELSGEEKLRAYRERFGDAPIDEFYSDSRRDAPLAALAKRAFIVKKGGIVVPWDEDGEKTEI